MKNSILNDNPVKIWDACLRIIKEIVEEPEYETFFADIVPLEYKEKTLKVQVKSHFIYEYLEENYPKLLRNVLNRVLGPKSRLQYVIKVTPREKMKLPGTFGGSRNHHTGNSFPLKKPIPSPHSIPGLEADTGIDSNLNPNYRFENFISGASNEDAKHIAVSVAENMDTSFMAGQVVFFYGGSGVGKTHLLHAIGNTIKENNPKKVVYYTSGNAFTTNFIKATQNKNKNAIQSWLNFFANIDVFLIDDLEFIIGKQKTIDFFFQIFNQLTLKRKTIIIAADRPPSEFQNLEEKWRSRLAGGLTTKIASPDYETRLKILRKKIEEEGVEIPEEVVEYIAKNLKKNIREIEGTIITLAFHGVVAKKKVDMELAREVIGNLIKTSRKNVTPEEIKRVVADFYNVNVEDLAARRRTQNIAIARHMAIHFIRKHLNLSLQLIGSYFGNRDHSTVINSLNNVQEIIDTPVDTPEKRAYQKLAKIVEGLFNEG